MKKFKHKILSIMLSVAMVTAFFPTGPFNTVSAADYINISTSGLDLTSEPTEITTYSTDSGTIEYNPSTSTLTLNNASIDTISDNSILLPTKPVTINVIGNNNIEGRLSGIKSTSGLITIKGTGTLDFGTTPLGIDCFNSLTITEDVQVITSAINVSQDFIYESTKNLNTCVYTNASENLTIYGNANYNSAYPYGTLTVLAGATLTIAKNEKLSVEEINSITNNGTIVNNGVILLNVGASQSNVDEVVHVLKPIGSGVIVVGDYENVYTNKGIELNTVYGVLNFSDGLPASGFDNCYIYTGNPTDGYTLQLNNLYLTGTIILPGGVPVAIQTSSASTIEGSIDFDGYNACNLSFLGTAPLTINGDISGGTNFDMIKVKDGANVTINGSISVGASGNYQGTMQVSGTGTTMNINSSLAYAVACDTLNVDNGANMTLRTSGTLTTGAKALEGGINVTNGSTLTTGCDYGVYIEGGMLNVDDTSILITNGAISAFCIVDKTNLKTLGDVIKLPGLPTGTGLSSVVGTDRGYRYWSHILTGGSLGVTGEYSEPVNLSGAARGRYVFQKAPTSPGSVTGGATIEPNLSVPVNSTKPIITEKFKPVTSVSIPQTGDNRTIFSSIILFIISLSALVIVTNKRKFKILKK